MPLGCHGSCGCGSLRHPSNREVMLMARPHHPHSHSHAYHYGDGTAHRHIHGAVEPTLVTTQRGLWAIKWSFVVLGATALIQVMIVWLSGSMALLADTIHNFGDAATALP